MKSMSCYFLKKEVIRAVEGVRGASDGAAIEHALLLYERRKDEFAGFELWDGNRCVLQHPESVRRSA
jgi:hypothetical protein